MTDLQISIAKVPDQQGWELLLLADPSESLIKAYLAQGHYFEARRKEGLVGVMVLLPNGIKKLEIKNLAIAPDWQRRGYAKQLLNYAEEWAWALNFKTLSIGTGNSSLYQLALYQKQGFEVCSVIKNYFVDQYTSPIIENGIPCKHLILLEKRL